MTLKTLIIRIVIIVGILLTLYIIGLFYATRRVNTDISNSEPYNKVVDKIYATKQVCYLHIDALTGKKSTAYSLRMKTDGNPKYFIKTPIGTAMKINSAVSSYGAVSGSTSEYLEGSIYVKELNREVKFNYYWRDKKYHSDNKYYYIYELAPWQEKAMPFKFDLEGNKLSYHKKQEEEKLKISELNGIIRSKGNTNLMRLFVIDNAVETDKPLEIKYKFNYFENALNNFDYTIDLSDKIFFLSTEEIEYLGLNTIHPNLSSSKIFPIGYIKLSDKFESRILSFVNDKEINVKLITFTKDDKIIDVVTIFQLLKDEKRPRKHTKYLNKHINIFMATDKEIYKDPKIYKIDNNGKMIIID